MKRVPAVAQRGEPLGDNPLRGPVLSAKGSVHGQVLGGNGRHSRFAGEGPVQLQRTADPVKFQVRFRRLPSLRRQN